MTLKVAVSLPSSQQNVNFTTLRELRSPASESPNNRDIVGGKMNQAQKDSYLKLLEDSWQSFRQQHGPICYQR